jgi:hypothetical protein
MATVKVVDLLAKVQTLLQDTTGVRWPLLELQGWLNDSYRDTLTLRPDSNTLLGEFTCVAGPRQNVTSTFANAERLIGVLRNTATTSKKGAIALASRSSLDSALRNWYAETQTVDVELYMFDPRTPKEFLVYPPATTAARLEVAYAQVPSPHTLTSEQLANAATTETIRIADGFANALVDYVLYRAYSKNTESTTNAAKAGAYFQSFQGALGIKGQSEAASQPGVA